LQRETSMNEEIYNALKAIDKITKEPIKEGHLGDMANRVELDHEVQLARGQLYKIAKYAIKMHEMLRDVSEVQGLEGWVSAKITKAATYMDDVGHYLEYDMSPANITNEGMEVTRGRTADLLHKVDEHDNGIPHEHPHKGYTQDERDSMRDLINRTRPVHPEHGSVAPDGSLNVVMKPTPATHDMTTGRPLTMPQEEFDAEMKRLKRLHPGAFKPELPEPGTGIPLPEPDIDDPASGELSIGVNPDFSERVARQNADNEAAGPWKDWEPEDDSNVRDWVKDPPKFDKDEKDWVKYPKTGELGEADDLLDKRPYRLPINPDTGEPWTDEEKGPMRRIPKPGGMGYYTGDNSGIYTGTMEYVPGRDDPPGGFKQKPLPYRPFKNWGKN
jgi:hypothetical protein